MISQEDAATTIESAKILLFKVSLDGQILGWNEKAAELFSDGQDLPKIQKLVVRRNKQFDEVFTKCATSPPSEALFEATMKCQDDVHLPVLLSLVRNENVINVLGLVISSLEQKLVEDMQNRLTSLVTQELRSPLNGMVGLTTALCKSPALSAPMKKQLGVLRSSSSRLLDLVTNIMDLSEAPEEAKVNFAELVEEVFVMTNAAVDRSHAPLVKPGVELKNKLKDMTQIPLVLGDRHKFLDLLYNLITNACKFTTMGTVTISAEHVNESEELELRIADTGCGIQNMSQILRPFRTDPDRAKQIQTFQGAGLGLAVCKETVELHRGSLTVESSEAGSTFLIRLPCLAEYGEVEKDPCSPSGPAPVAASSPSPPRKQKLRPVILHVDLDAKIQLLCKESFAEKYEIVAGVSQVEEWLQKEESPDIVLLDARTPLVLYHKVCTCVQRMRQPPVMLFSVDAPGMLALESLPNYEKLKDFVLLKPFDVKSLETKFRDVLKEPIKQSESSPFAQAFDHEVLEMSTQKATEEIQRQRSALVEGEVTSDIQKLKQEMAEWRARDLRLADQLRHQSCLNAAVLKESGVSGTSEQSRFAIEKVDLKSFVDEVIAKVQERKVGMPQGALLNGLEGSPIVMGNRKMIERMILKLLESGNVEKSASVSIKGKLRDKSIEITLDLESKEGEAERPYVQSFSLQCLPGSASECKASRRKVKRERPLLLAIDDEEQHRSMLQSALGSEFELAYQMNGKAALDWLEQQQDLPDLVLLDSDMPGMTGFEVCRSIRKKHSITELPIILLYDKAPAVAVLEVPVFRVAYEFHPWLFWRQGLDSGSNDLIVKPFEAEVLKEKVFFHLDLTEASQEIQKQKIRYLELRVSEQAAEIGRLREDRDPTDKGSALESWRLRRQVAKRLLLSGGKEVNRLPRPCDLGHSVSMISVGSKVMAT
eukprot:symbB.v1.2.026928.t1/scaffold2698.1/size85437/4